MTNENFVNMKVVKNLSPAAQLVYHTLLISKKMHVGEIKKNTSYSSRTIRYALRQLRNAHLIIQIPDLRDLRRYHYAIKVKN